MALVEQPLEAPETLQENERAQLLALAEQLAQPEISQETRLDLVMQLRLVLTRSALAYQVSPIPVCEMPLLDHSPPLMSG